LHDVLRTAVAAELDAVWVITRDDEVSAIARALGATVLGERENRCRTAAVALAQQRAAEASAHVFVPIPGDVPLVTADEIRTLAAAARSASAAFTPSRSRLGTNGVALSPPTLMPLTFGEPSFDNHLAAARERGLTPAVLALPGLGVDIDSPEDLPLLLAEGAATDSARLLALDGGASGPRSVPGRGHLAGVASHRADGPRHPHRRDAPRLGLRQRGRRSVERRPRCGRAAARGSGPLRADAARAPARARGRRRGRHRRRHVRPAVARGPDEHRDRRERHRAAPELPRPARPRRPRAPGDHPRAGRRGGGRRRAGHGQTRSHSGRPRARPRSAARRARLETPAARSRPRAVPLAGD